MFNFELEISKLILHKDVHNVINLCHHMHCIAQGNADQKKNVPFFQEKRFFTAEGNRKGV